MPIKNKVNYMFDDNQNILTPQDQIRLGTPMADDDFNSEENKFLREMIKKIEDGQIKILEPATILNQEVYEKLTETNEHAVDLIAHRLLAILRQIRDLWEMDHHLTMQMKNLITEVKHKKEEGEKKYGDVFKI